MANAHKATWQQMQQESAQELIHRQGQQALLILVGSVAPPKGYLPVLKRHETVIGNGHAVCVGAEIAKYLFRASERSSAMGDPASGEKLTDEAAK